MRRARSIAESDCRQGSRWNEEAKVGGQGEEEEEEFIFREATVRAIG